nr:hypothetical protein [uncultured Microbacterium sp.]
MTSPTKSPLSKSDSGALLGFSIAGVLIAAYISFRSVLRIIELAGGENVAVPVEFAGDSVDLPLSDGSGSVAVGLDRATLTAADLPAIAAVPGILAQVVQIITIVVVIGCLLVLARSIVRGRIFSRAHTALVSTAGITGLVGFAAVQFFDNMLANATVHAVTDNRIDTTVLSIEPFTFVLGAFIIALIGTVFVIGDRLQRDTDGLV